MATVTSRITGIDHDAAEWALRVDLAAAFRLAARFGWHESVANHFSAAVSADGKTFLLNPRWRHFSNIRASDLLLLDADDDGVMEREDAPDPSAWCIHGAIHAAVPHARVLLHCHPIHSTALCGLKDPAIKPIDQNTARFHSRAAIDLGYGGIADDDHLPALVVLAEEIRGLNRVLAPELRVLADHVVRAVVEVVGPKLAQTPLFVERRQ